MTDDRDVPRDASAKAEHETAVDGALSALGTAAGSQRVRSHLTERAPGVALEDLAEALRRFRERPPT